MKSIGFIAPNGSSSWAMFPANAGPVEVAEAMAKEAGGNNWPLKIEGQAVQSFDFSNAKEKIYDITWAPSKDLNYYRREMQKAIDEAHEKEDTDAPDDGATASKSDGLVAQFTESRAAAVEAEFGQLILSCLDNIEETIDTLVVKKIELIKERARIEATIKVLEERIDGFQKRAGGIIEAVDPFEQDVEKLGGFTNLDG